MDKNNTSNSNPSVCNKIRQAIASNPAIRIINRMSSYNQEPKHAKLGSISTSSPSLSSSSSSPSPNSTPIQIRTKPHIPQQQEEKGNHKEASPRTIPIKFDHSTPKSSPPFVATKLQSATNKGHGQEHDHFHHHHQHHHHDGMHQEQQGKKSMMNIDETFNEYIQRAKKKIRTMSNIGRGHNNATSEDQESQGGGGANEKDHQHRDQFSEFINRAKKKIRTTTIVRKSNSLRKG
ncbi:hypothetical protein PIB30_030163 [Stylosanthes scabra]|uniref:Uncharacterized protein n=1 Tax=Stylosanthes scabra TaxID=79078 RepID=A0ABU6RC60_9FABA|nr:hypothetical protein [Stylosanthes scabra]